MTVLIRRTYHNIFDVSHSPLVSGVSDSCLKNFDLLSSFQNPAFYGRPKLKCGAKSASGANLELP
ncbi:hypothetical protein B9Q04_11770 [Candidatus Marsarchaeota G2 archaeon BE_D]|uniref:Uncharacterized protein n=1 Tax=Candidatus Marsarchaeota G2 archaeon BE_D TaxID=1978158 RepID=A0A2R6C8R4_9ARCH|nr:MAG: hypothetical protein B9Q04_11770 [Candidatus Marsarchaeota G2 archaeon BE_D]